MKTVESIKLSAEARMDQLRMKATELLGIVEEWDHYDEPTNREMSTVRRLVGEIAQTFHEFNAYRNVLETE